MPVPSQINVAAYAFRQNNALLAKSIDGLTAEEWLRSPKETSNPPLWIVGHLVWARSMALKFLGTKWERPWLPLFARGAKPPSTSECPSYEEVLLGWQEVTTSLTAAMEGASDEVLAGAAPEKSPSFDGKISGMVTFLAFHEAYHVGQAAYLRCWMGHSRIVG
jgi:hypothetical protein